jgi:ActR/RegA family two-component response regulator
MSEAAARYETGRSTLRYFRPAAASRGKMVSRSPGTLCLAPYHRSAVSQESCPPPDLRTLAITNGRADHGTSGQLLFIGDDWALMAEQLRRAFPAPAHRLQVAGTAHAGLEYARTQSPDVIVLDLALPDRAGLEVYQQIRHMNAHLPVIVVAGARRADVAIEPIKQGAYDCLFKPSTCPRWAGSLPRRWTSPGAYASRLCGSRPRRTWTPGLASSAPARPWARCTRPSAASPPRTCRC